jgi:hypothetical protein
MVQVFELSILYCLSKLAVTDEDSHLYFGELTKALSRLCLDIYPLIPTPPSSRPLFTKLFLLHICATSETVSILRLYKDIPIGIRDLPDVVFARDFIDDHARVLISYCLGPYRGLSIVNRCF